MHTVRQDIELPNPSYGYIRVSKINSVAEHFDSGSSQFWDWSRGKSCRPQSFGICSIELMSSNAARIMNSRIRLIGKLIPKNANKRSLLYSL